MKKLYRVEYLYSGKWVLWGNYTKRAHAIENIKVARRYGARLCTYTLAKVKKYERM